MTFELGVNKNKIVMIPNAIEKNKFLQFRKFDESIKKKSI